MKITPLVASTFRSDAGTAFGPVPKAIWARLVSADARNTIPVTANVLLVELPDGRKGLVETGCGAPDRYSERERDIHGLAGHWPLEKALEMQGTSPEDIAFVVLTHLHWDHAGGVGRLAENGDTVLSFPSAVHYVHAQEWEDALSDNPLWRKAYPERTVTPLQQLEDASLHLVDADEEEVLPGLTMTRTGGHTRGHCAVILASDGLTLCHPGAEPFSSCRIALFAGDICPTQYHLPMAYQLAFDTFPLDTRAWKREWLDRFTQPDHILLFAHDPELIGATLERNDKQRLVVAKGLPSAAA